MRSHTVTTVLPAPRREVFAYMSEIEHLPESETDSRASYGATRTATPWSTTSAIPFRDPRRRGERRDRHVRRADAAQMAVFPTRVVELPDGPPPTVHDVPGPGDAGRALRRQYDR